MKFNAHKITLIVLGLSTLAPVGLVAADGPIDYRRDRGPEMGPPREFRENRRPNRQPPSPAYIAKRLVYLHDADDDGAISGAELKRVALAIAEHRPKRGRRAGEDARDPVDLAREIEARLQDEFDVDKDKLLSVDELQLALEEMRPPRPPRKPRQS